MKLNAIKVGLALSISSGLMWIFCSLLVYIMPNFMLSLSADMFHLKPENFQWDLSFTGMVFGLIAWAIFPGITGWLFATIYNRMIDL